MRVVDRVESRIGAVDGMEERQQVHAAERAGERSAQQLLHGADVAAEAIGVGDELDLLFFSSV